MNKIRDYIKYDIEVEIRDFYDTDYVKKAFGIDEKKCNVVTHQNDGLVIASKKYDYICPLNYGVHIALKGNKWGCLDESGKAIIPFKYDIINPFDAGLAVVKKGKKYGVIDTRGKKIIPCTYDYIDDFSIGYAAVSKGGKWGYASMTGFVFIEPKYDSAGKFKLGYARVETRGRFGIVNRHRQVIPCIYDDIDVFTDRLFKIKEDGKWGLIDIMGNPIIKCIYDDMKPLDNGLIFVSLDNRSAVINEKNEMISIIINDTILAKDDDDFAIQYENKYIDYKHRLNKFDTKYMSIIETYDSHIIIEADSEDNLIKEKEELKNNYKENIMKKLNNDLNLFDNSICDNLSDSYQKVLKRKK